MILSTTTSILETKLPGGRNDAVKIIAAAGFDAVDLSMCEMRNENDPFNGDGYLEEAKRLRATAEENGIYFNQAHAYFPTSFNEPEKTEAAFKKVVRGLETASAVGAKVVIVHPNQHLYYMADDNAKILREMNLKFYSSLIPYCERYGVKIAVENMWQRGKLSRVIVDSTCSRPAEFCEYVDMLNSPYITACLDIGHCGLVGQTAENMIRHLGRDRLGALHVHDNNGKEDNHVSPMLTDVSTVNWEEVCKALAEIDYKGDFTFEADRLFDKVTEVTALYTAKYLCEIGRYLIGKIEHYKNVIK